MSVLRSLLAPSVARPMSAMTFGDIVNMYEQAGGLGWGLNQTLVGDREEIDGSFVGFTAGAYRGNGVIFACLLARMQLFAQARLTWQQLRAGQPGDLFGTPDLRIVEQPEPGKQTADLLTKAIIDADLAGNSFYVRRPGRLKRLRPDWTSIILGSQGRNADLDPNDVDCEMVGLVYHPPNVEPRTFARDEVCHWAPIPDPLAHYRGMSWLTPIIREILADSAATSHKLAFFQNGATPNVIVKVNPAITDPVKYREWIALFKQEHEGVSNAYKTWFMGAGSDATLIGSNFQQIDFKVTQGAGETRIAAASGIHPVVLGLSEGLQGSALNAGNFAAARRLTADKALRPAWGGFAGSLETIVPAPSGSRLWYDERHIPFLAEDVKDAADVIGTQAESINKLVTGGYNPADVVDAVVSGDLRRLADAHSGLYSVQLQPPGSNPALPSGHSAIATRAFWPSSGFSAGLEVEAGAAFPSDAHIVRAFPQFFEVA